MENINVRSFGSSGSAILATGALIAGFFSEYPLISIILGGISMSFGFCETILYKPYSEEFNIGVFAAGTGLFAYGSGMYMIIF